MYRNLSVAYPRVMFALAVAFPVFAGACSKGGGGGDESSDLTEGTGSQIVISGSQPVAGDKLQTRISDSGVTTIVNTAQDLTPPVPGKSGAISVTPGINSLSVAWTAAVDGSSQPSQLTYEIYYSKTEELTTVSKVLAATKSSSVVGGTSATIGNLSPATTYYINVLVKDVAQNKAIYKTLTAATSVDGVAPTPPQNPVLTVLEMGATVATLQWSAAADNAYPAAELAYGLFYSTDANLTTVAEIEANGMLAGQFAAGATQLTATGLVADTSYYFNVIVKDPAGNKAVYERYSATTSKDLIAPIPGGGSGATLTASSIGPSGFILSWNKATDKVSASTSTPPAVLQYLVVYSTSQSVTSWAEICDIDSERICDTDPATVSYPDYKSGIQISRNWTMDIATAAITGLTPNTTYYFNVVVRDPGFNKEFYTRVTVTTLADSTAPVAGNAGSVSSNSVTNQALGLAWTKATDNVTAQAGLTYQVYRSASANMGSVALAEANGVAVGSATANIGAYSVTGLSPSTTYYFTVVVADAAGNKSVYQTHSATTAADAVAPTPGSGPTISAVTTTGMNIAWSAGADDISPSSSLQYKVKYSTANNLGSVNNFNANGVQVMDWTTNATSTSVSGLVPATTYYINVAVRDQAGNVAVYAGASQLTTTDSTGPTPGASGTLGSAGVSATGFTLSWTAASDDSWSAAGLTYRVYQSSANDMSSVGAAEVRTALNSATAGITSLAVSGLDPATTYYYNVVVADGSGNKSVYQTLSVTTASDAVPPVPGSSGTVTASSVATTSLTLNWTKGTDNISNAANLSYKVKYSPSNNLGSVANFNANGTLVQDWTTDIGTVNVTGLAANTTYYFNVLIRDEGNNEVVYSTLTQTTAADTTAPVPGNSGTVTTSAPATTSMTVSWSAASDETVGASLLEYRVFYSLANNMTDVASTEAGTAANAYSANITSLNVTGLNPGTTYYFNIVVRDPAGNKAAYSAGSATTSNDATAPVPGSSGTITPSAVGTGALTLSWTKATDAVSTQASLQYKVKYSTASNLTDVAGFNANGVLVQDWATDIDTVNVSALTPGTSYYFNVMTRDEAGNTSVYSQLTQATAADSTSPTAVSYALTYTAVTPTDMTVNWTKATDNAYDQPTLLYLVCKSATNNLTSLANCEAAAVGSYTTDIDSAGVSGLLPATTYYFNVIAKDPAGNRRLYTQSSQASAADATAPVPGSTGTLSYSSVTTKSITVSWTKATDNAYAQSSLQYQVCYSTSNNIGSNCSGGTTANSYTADISTLAVNNLAPGTTYYFNVLVRDPSTNVAAYTSASNATTADTTAPSPGAAGALSTANLAGTSVDLNWTTATDDTYAQSTLQYLACKSTSNNLTSVLNCENAGVNGAAVYSTDINTMFVSGLSAATTYYLNVVAKDSSGNRVLYSGTSVTTPSDVTPPTPGGSGNMSSSGVTTTQMTVSWSAASDVSTPITYLVYYADSDTLDTVANTESTGTPVGTYASGLVSKTITGLTPSTDYFYVVIAKDNFGNKAVYNSNTATTLADTTSPTPGASGSISAGSVLTVSMDLSWTKSTDDSFPQATLSYLVCKSTSATLTSVAACEASPYGSWTADIGAKTVTGLSPNIPYYFNVVVKDQAGNKALYSQLSQATPADTTAPVPGNSGSIGKTMGTYQASLTWTKASDETYPQTALQYLPCVSAANDLGSVAGCEAKAFGSWTTNIAAKAVTGLTPGTLYYFNLLVRDSDGNKAVYTSMSGTTTNDVTPPSPGNSGTINVSSKNPISITLDWTKGSDNASPVGALTYAVARSSSANIGTVNGFDANGTTVSDWQTDIDSVVATGLRPSTTYYFNVKIADVELNEAVYSMFSATTDPDLVAPTPGGGGTVTLTQRTKNSIDVSWAAASDDWASHADLEYKVCYGSALAEVDTAAECDTADGTVYQPGITTAAVTSLNPSTAYAIGVVVKDMGGNLALYTNLQTRTVSAVHISYQDSTNTDLKYATDTGSGTFTTEVVDTTGSYSAIVLDSNKKPHLLYSRGTTGSGRPNYVTKASGSWSAPVELMAKNTTFVSLVIDGSNKLYGTFYETGGRDAYYVNNVSGSWTNGTIEATNRPGQHNSTAMDSGGFLHTSFYESSNLDLRYATNKSGSWVVTSIDATGSVGTFTSICVDSNDDVHIAYYDSTNTNLKYATNMSGSWVTSTIHNSTGTVGQYAAIACDSSDNLHLAYYDAANKDVLYMKKDFGTGNWSTPVIVDGSQNADSFQWINLALGSDGLLHLSYYDSTATDLYYTYGDGTTWVTTFVDGSGVSTGKWSRIAAE